MHHHHQTLQPPVGHGAVRHSFSVNHLVKFSKVSSWEKAEEFRQIDLYSNSSPLFCHPSWASLHSDCQLPAFHRPHKALFNITWLAEMNLLFKESCLNCANGKKWEITSDSSLAISELWQKHFFYFLVPRFQFLITPHKSKMTFSYHYSFMCMLQVNKKFSLKWL